MTGTVEVDETYVGGKRQGQAGPWRGWQRLLSSVAALERGGNVLPVVVERHGPPATVEAVVELAAEQVEAKINTDEYASVQRAARS